LGFGICDLPTPSDGGVIQIREEETIDLLDVRVERLDHVIQRRRRAAAVRKRLKLSQREFASQYHINLQTLRQWEQGTRYPDTTSLAYLTCIAKKPNIIKDILISGH